MKWFNTLSHNRWLEQETDRIFDFGKNSVVPTGFGWLGNKGQIKEEMGTHLWITARMLHVYSVAAAMGRPGAYSLVDHGIKAMNGALRDKKYGGWYACVNDEGVVDASKQGYQHFFALLGAASAVTTGHPEARKLLDYAIEIIEILLERRRADVPGVLGRSLQQNRRVPRRQCQHARGGSLPDCL